MNLSLESLSMLYGNRDVHVNTVLDPALYTDHYNIGILPGSGDAGQFGYAS